MNPSPELEAVMEIYDPKTKKTVRKRVVGFREPPPKPPTMGYLLETACGPVSLTFKEWEKIFNEKFLELSEGKKHQVLYRDLLDAIKEQVQREVCPK